MPHHPTPKTQLASFLAKFTPEIEAQASAILDTMRTLYPTAIELVYDNYNALAVGFCPSERTSESIFSIAVYPRWVSLFFLQANGIPDPRKLLKGNGNVAKHIVLTSTGMLSDPAIRTLMLEAESRAKVLFNPNGTHKLIIKSISEKQRARRPETNPALAIKKQ